MRAGLLPLPYLGSRVKRARPGLSWPGGQDGSSTGIPEKKHRKRKPCSPALPVLCPACYLDFYQPGRHVCRREATANQCCFHNRHSARLHLPSQLTVYGGLIVQHESSRATYNSRKRERATHAAQQWNWKLQTCLQNRNRKGQKAAQASRGWGMSLFFLLGRCEKAPLIHQVHFYYFVTFVLIFATSQPEGVPWQRCRSRQRNPSRQVLRS